MLNSLKLMYKRWPEVLLVILFTGGAMLMMIEHDKNTNASEAVTMLMAIVTGIFMVLGYIFQIGFLRTVVIQPDDHFHPTQLLMIGRQFLWRIVGFSIILAIIFFILANAFLAAMITFFSDIDIQNSIKAPTQEIPDWYSLVAAAAALILFLKYWLFVPALIIVTDCKLLESWKLIKPVKLFKAREVWLWLILIILFNCISWLAAKYIKVNGTIDTIIGAFSVFTSVLVAFGLQLAAVKYIKKVFGKNHPEQPEGTK